MFRVPTGLEQATMEIEARVKRRASWTRAQQSSSITTSQTIPFETRSLSIDYEADVFETGQVQVGTMIQRPPPTQIKLV